MVIKIKGKHSSNYCCFSPSSNYGLSVMVSVWEIASPNYACPKLITAFPSLRTGWHIWNWHTEERVALISKKRKQRRGHGGMNWGASNCEIAIDKLRRAMNLKHINSRSKMQSYINTQVPLYLVKKRVNIVILKMRLCKSRKIFPHLYHLSNGDASLGFGNELFRLSSFWYSFSPERSL